MLAFLIHNAVSLELALFALSFLAGGFGALVGLGGGILLVPGMVLLLGIHIRYAIGASIVSVIATSCGAAAAYVEDRLTNIRVAILLEVATTSGAFSGAYLTRFLNPTYLQLLFVLILLLSAGMMMRGKSQKSNRQRIPGRLENWLRLHSHYPEGGQKIPYVVTRADLGLVLMFGAGLISSLLGIGSGALKVPAMDTAMGLPIKVSAATSNFMIGVTAAASAGPYFLRGEILPILAAPIALGILSGSWLGARWMRKLHSLHLRRIFVITLLVVAAQMIVKLIQA